MLPVPLNSWKISSSMRRTGVHQCGGENRERPAVLNLARGGKHLARNFQSARVHAAGHRATTAAVNTVVGAGDARERIKQHENILARLDDAAAALDHEARKADVRFQIHVVRRRDDFGLHRALKIRDFFRAFVKQHNNRVNFRMIRRDRIANLLEDGRLARARRRDDDAARAFADRRDEVNHARLDQVRRGLELKFFNRVNAREVLEADDFRVILERQVVDLLNGLELRAGAAMRRLRGADDMAALAQKIAADGIGRDEDVGRLGMKMIGGGAQKSEALLGDFKIARTEIRRFLAVVFCIAHNCFV